MSCGGFSPSLNASPLNDPSQLSRPDFKRIIPMRKQTIALSAALLSLAATGSIALAQTNGTQTSGTQTGGGSLTRAEAQTRASAAFDRMDINDDGRLDQADRTARRNARFDRLDTDGNGSLSRTEFAAMHGMRGERADRSERSGEARQDRRGRRGAGKGRMGGMGGRDMMQKMDANGDGSVTQAEFIAQAMTRFAAADSDNDGTVTAAERRQARKSARAARAN